MLNLHYTNSEETAQQQYHRAKHEYFIKSGFGGVEFVEQLKKTDLCKTNRVQ